LTKGWNTYSHNVKKEKINRITHGGFLNNYAYCFCAKTVLNKTEKWSFSLFCNKNNLLSSG